VVRNNVITMDDLINMEGETNDYNEENDDLFH